MHPLAPEPRALAPGHKDGSCKGQEPSRLSDRAEQKSAGEAKRAPLGHSGGVMAGRQSLSQVNLFATRGEQVDPTSACFLSHTITTTQPTAEWGRRTSLSTRVPLLLHRLIPANGTNNSPSSTSPGIGRRSRVRGFAVSCLRPTAGEAVDRPVFPRLSQIPGPVDILFSL